MSLSLPSEAATAGHVIVNKRELARALNVALPTIAGYLDRYDDFPVIQEGDQGREWQFDLVAVRRFLDLKTTEEKAKAAQRAAAVAQFALPIDPAPTADADPAQMTPQQRLAFARALQTEQELARESGLLVPVTDVRSVHATAIPLLANHFDSILLQAARKFQWPPVQLREIQAMFRDGREDFIRKLRQFRPDADGPVVESATESALL